MFKHI